MDPAGLQTMVVNSHVVLILFFFLLATIWNDSFHLKQARPAAYEISIAAVSNLSKLNQSNAKSQFDYLSYWESVQAKFLNITSRKNRKVSTCPKVYIHNITNDFFGDEGPDFSLNFSNVFGNPQPPDGLVHMGSRIESLSRVLEYRIRTSRHCQTDNPFAADLFLVPIFPRHRPRQVWREVSCGRPPSEVVQLLLQELHPHLSKHNACKHFFGFSRSFHSIQGCEGWWRSPKDELLSSFMRLGLTEHFYRRSAASLDVGYHADGDDHSLYPNHHSVPYISSFHWRGDQPAPYLQQDKQRIERPITMLFVGSTFHGDVPVRQQIEQQCRSYRNSSICHLEITHVGRIKGKDRRMYGLSTKKRKIKQALKKRTTNISMTAQISKKSRIVDMLHKKLDATFCLEPGGDTPDRKSISDSISAGCIPVFFSNATAVGSWGWFWSDWKHLGHIMVPRRDFVTGKIDLYTLLHSTMPLYVRNKMQDTLATEGRRMQYSLNEDADDAVRIILDGLKKESSKRLDENGNCHAEEAGKIVD